MTGEVHWLPFVALIVAATPVLAYWLHARRANKNFVVEESTVRCAAHGNQLLNVTLVRDSAHGEPIGIRKCSAANPNDVVRCNKSCLPKFVQVNKAG